MKKIKKLQSLDLHLILLLFCLCLGYYVYKSYYSVLTIYKFEETKSKPVSLDTFSEANLNSIMYILEIEHPEVVIAQSKLETGNYTSSIFKENHNLFGFRKGKSYYKYKDWKESVLHYAHWQNMNYRVNEDYFVFLKRIKYAEDSNYIPKLKKICIK